MSRVRLLLLCLSVAACAGAPPAAPGSSHAAPGSSPAASLTPEAAMDRLRAAVPASFLEHCDAATYTESFPAEPGELAGLECDFPRGDVVDYATYTLFDSASSMNAYHDLLAAGVTSGGNAQGAGCDSAQPGPATWNHGRALCYTFLTDDAYVRWTHEGLNIAASAFRDDGDFAPLVGWWRTAGPTE